MFSLILIIIQEQSLFLLFNLQYKHPETTIVKNSLISLKTEYKYYEY